MIKALFFVIVLMVVAILSGESRPSVQAAGTVWVASAH